MNRSWSRENRLRPGTRQNDRPHRLAVVHDRNVHGSTAEQVVKHCNGTFGGWLIAVAERSHSCSGGVWLPECVRDRHLNPSDDDKAPSRAGTPREVAFRVQATRDIVQ